MFRRWMIFLFILTALAALMDWYLLTQVELAEEAYLSGDGDPISDRAYFGVLHDFNVAVYVTMALLGLMILSSIVRWVWKGRLFS